MSYQLIIDDQFQRANTSVGTGANSTTGVGVPDTYFSPSTGGAWIDFVGNLYNIQSNVLADWRAISIAPSNLPLDSLYRPSIENYHNGKVTVYSSSTGTSVGVTARFNPANGGNGYAAMLYNGTQFWIYKAVNGTQTLLVGAIATNATKPTHFILELVVINTNASTAQLTVNLYNQTAPTTVIATTTITDTDATLQTAGAWGVSSYGGGTGNGNGSSWTRIQTYQVGAALSAGTLTFGKVFKTVVNVSGTAAAGGTAPISYQWYRSTSSGVQGPSISGATSTSLADIGLSPNTRYYYTLVATDSSTPTPQSVTYSQISTKTLPTTGMVLLQIGDSITVGNGSSMGDTYGTMNAADTMTYLLNQAGIPCANINSAVIGTGVGGAGQWGYTGNSYLANAIALSAAAGGADTVSIMLGTNDGNMGLRTTNTNYYTAMSNLVSMLYSSIPTLTKVFLHYSPYAVPGSLGGNFDATSDTLIQSYEPEIDALVNNTTIYAGDKTAYSFFFANQGDLADGVHPNETGHTWLGGAWATAVETALAPLTISPVSTPASTGATLTANASGGTLPYTYAWSGSGITFSSHTVSTPTGTVTAAGTYTASVTVTDAKLAAATATTTFTISSIATTVSVSPTTVTLALGGTEQFSGTVFDQFGNTISSPTLTWTRTSTSDSITSGGLYTAPSMTSTVTATCGSATGTATVSFGSAPAMRTIVWNSFTNNVPLLTAPEINVAYANDRKSATITITCDVNDAIIRYETNGRYATTNINSPIYTGPITVTQSAVFSACWYFNGLKSYAAHASVYLPT